MSNNEKTINNEKIIKINLDNEEEGYCWKHEVAILPCEDCENGVKCDDWEEDEEEKQCERCGGHHCEEDEEHEERELWESNKDGKNICRKCIREEDEEEDKE